MRLDMFVGSEIERLKRFRDAWREANRAAPASFPLSLDAGEWDEALEIWDGLPFDTEDLE